MATANNQPGKKRYDEPLPQWLARMLGRVRGIWPTFQIEIAAEEYGKTLRELADEFGRERVESGVERAKRQHGMANERDQSASKFAPSCGELRMYVEQSGGGKVEHPADCKLCNSGWVNLPGTNRVRRCPEWRRVSA